MLSFYIHLNFSQMLIVLLQHGKWIKNDYQCNGSRMNNTNVFHFTKLFRLGNAPQP